MDMQTEKVSETGPHGDTRQARAEDAVRLHQAAAVLERRGWPRFFARHIARVLNAAADRLDAQSE